MPRVITVGEILVEIMANDIDQSFLKPGQLTGPYASGAPAIFIDQVARLQGDCGIVASIGDDDFGVMNYERLKEDGVDVSQIVTRKNYTTGTAFVTYYSDGSREFIYHFTHSAAGQLSPDDIDYNYISSASYLHIMGCSLSTSQSMRAAISKAVKIAEEEGLKISFDPNLRPELLDVKEVREIFSDILYRADIILSGREELTALMPGSEKQNINKLIDSGVEIIVLKSAAQDVKVYENDNLWSYTPPQVEEVDPTGAGDCFDGAFIAALAEGYGTKKAVARGAAAGAISVMKKGPMEGAAYQHEIDKYIDIR